MRDPDERLGQCRAPTACMVQDKNHVCDLDFARQARPADPREIFQAGQALPGADLLRARSAAVPRRRQRAEASACRNTTMPAATAASPTSRRRAKSTACRCRRMPRSCSKARWSRASTAQGRPVRRVHRLLRVEPERAAGGARASASITATIRSSRIASPMRPPSDFSFSKCVMKAGMIWDEVERAGLVGRRRRVGARVRRRAHVQRHRDQAGLSGPRAAGRACWRRAASPAPISGASSWWSTRTSIRPTCST